MSEISERCYYATWMKNLEYVLWDAIHSGQRKYGHDTITIADITILKALSDKSQSWIYFHDHLEETALIIGEWTNKFQAEINKDATLLNG